ncbi:hypothetical protein [Streptomyces sp. NPDC127197]|uniref:hypothetical protein n=1 Tax=Streptomyces sp. NPDC127197 TaxID=3345388 RepID=UPI003643AE3F
MRRQRAAAAALSALAAAVLTGCGIQETDVIEAGGPPTIQVFPHGGDGLVLFFRTPQQELVPVIRDPKGDAEEMPQNGPAGTRDPEEPEDATARAVTELFGGPYGKERAAGLIDGLPALGPGGPAVRTLPPEQGGVEVTLPVALATLDDLAIRQLVCTIAFSRDADGQTSVYLRGDDGALERTSCDADVDHGVLPRPTLRPSLPQATGTGSPHVYAWGESRSDGSPPWRPRAAFGSLS